MRRRLIELLAVLVFVGALAWEFLGIDRTEPGLEQDARVRALSELADGHLPAGAQLLRIGPALRLLSPGGAPVHPEASGASSTYARYEEARTGGLPFFALVETQALSLLLPGLVGLSGWAQVDDLWLVSSVARPPALSAVSRPQPQVAGYQMKAGWLVRQGRVEEAQALLKEGSVLFPELGPNPPE